MGKETKPKAKKAATSELDELVLEDATTPVEVSPDKLEQITLAADQLKAAILSVDRVTDELAKANEEVKRLSETVLPTFMDEAGVKSLKLTDGSEVLRSQLVFASISKDNATAACEWLQKNGYGDIVKASIEIPIGRGDEKLQKLVRAWLVKTKVGFEETMGVHSGTLRAFVKESLEESRALPATIKVHVQPKVEIKTPKRK